MVGRASCEPRKSELIREAWGMPKDATGLLLVSLPTSREKLIRAQSLGGARCLRDQGGCRQAGPEDTLGMPQSDKLWLLIRCERTLYIGSAADRITKCVLCGRFKFVWAGI